MVLTTRQRITQRTGARVIHNGCQDCAEAERIGTVVGHYDDDSVYVQWDGEATPERWWTDALALVP